MESYKKQKVKSVYYLRRNLKRGCISSYVIQPRDMITGSPEGCRKYRGLSNVLYLETVFDDRTMRISLFPLRSMKFQSQLILSHLVKISYNFIEHSETLDTLVVCGKLHIEIVKIVRYRSKKHSNLTVMLTVQLLKKKINSFNTFPNDKVYTLPN